MTTSDLPSDSPLSSDPSDWEEKIKRQLQTIIDPDLNQDIVSLGFVKNLTPLGENGVALTLELTTPACPVKETFRQQAQELIKELGFDEVRVTLSSATRSRPQGLLDTVKSIVAVSSCKGGVGKSTAAALLAAELASRGFRVGLLDLDIFGPSLPTLFGISLNGVQSQNQKLIPYEFSEFPVSPDKFSENPHEKPILKLMSFGFLLGDSAAIMRGPMVSNYIQQLLHQVDWGELDYLFIDMPPGTGDTQLTVSQTVRLDGAVIVTTPQSLSLVDVARGIIMYEKVKVPILGIVENMAYFICDQCQHRHYPFSGEGVRGLQDRFGTPLLAQLPFLPLPQVFFQNYRSFPEAVHLADKTVREIGKKILDKLGPPKIEFNEKNIHLFWEGKEIRVPTYTLRSNCGCALCVDEFTGKRKIAIKDIPPDIIPLRVDPLGNYALSIEWSDGHTSGIYPYQMIERLSNDGQE